MTVLFLALTVSDWLLLFSSATMGLAVLTLSRQIFSFNFGSLTKGKEWVGFEDATVEKDRCRVDESAACKFYGKVAGVGESDGLTSEERAQMAGHSGVLRVGQSHLRQSGVTRRLRQLAHWGLRCKAVGQHAC